MVGTLTAGTVGFTKGRDVTITPSGTVNGTSATLELSGDWDNTGSFVPGTSSTDYVDVEDNNALPGNNIPLPSNSVKGPNSPGWLLTPAIPLLPPLAGLMLLGALFVLARRRLAAS